MDVEKQQLLQTPGNCQAVLQRIFFEVGKKKVCPPVEKGGGCFDTIATIPVS